MSQYPIYLGCTRARHAQIGVHAIVNARGGMPELNDLTNEDWALRRDARAIRDRVEKRIRFYQFNSRFCRRHAAHLEHLLSRYDD